MSRAISPDQHVIEQPKSRSFLRRHRNLLLILGIGIATAIAIAIAAAICAPSLVAMPAFLYMSMKLSVALGIALNSKIIVGSIFAASAVIGGGLAAATTATVLAITKFFKRRSAPEKRVSIEPVDADIAPIVIVSDSPAPKKTARIVQPTNTQSGLKRFGKFASVPANKKIKLAEDKESVSTFVL